MRRSILTTPSIATLTAALFAGTVPATAATSDPFVSGTAFDAWRAAHSLQCGGVFLLASVAFTVLWGTID